MKPIPEIKYMKMLTLLLPGMVRPVRRNGGILVSHVDLTPDRVRERDALDWLDEDELERWERYKVDRPRREFALCRAALRYLLCRRLGCTNSKLSFVAGDHGKPSARINGASVPVRFNVSHSDPHGLITIAAGKRVGVDVEAGMWQRDFDGIARIVFGPNECAEIASVRGEQKAHLFFRFWTLKEALVKALGTGLSINLREFEIPPDIRQGAKRSHFQFPGKPDTIWALENLSTPNYAAAIAVEKGLSRVH